jgi:excisionase family DNA binding protein
VLIDVTTACKLVRKSRKTIYKWIHTGRVRTMPTHDGRHLICYTSLFRPPGKEEDEPPMAAAKKN